MKNPLAAVLVISSACAVAALCTLPATGNVFPIWVIGAGAHIGDTLFHELGHTVFNWLFGTPAVPMIFTLFGRDQTPGMCLAGERMWWLQLAAFAVLAYRCYRLRQSGSALFVPLVAFSLVVAVLAFTPHYRLVILYMGHGGAAAVGGWLFYRGLLYLDSRNQFERWLNVFLGFFLILHNFCVGYMLTFNAGMREDYIEHTAFGTGDNDFQAMADRMWHWNVKGIAEFTMCYCCAVFLISALLAAYRLKTRACSQSSDG